MPAQYDEPLDYDFGLDFDYSLWTEDSEVTLCVVPWDAEYRDVVRFADRAALDAYIDSLPGSVRTTITDLSYVKPNMPIAIGLRHNVANKFNYIRVRNPLQPGGGDMIRNFYYFINSTDYAAPDTTVLNVQLDLWQTYIYDIKFGNAFIERGHIGIANSKNFDSFGREYLTVPEGMDIGSEYLTVEKRDMHVMGRFFSEQYQTIINDFSVIAVATQDLLAPPTRPNPADPSNPLPNFATAKGSDINSLPSGASLFAWESTGKFTSWLTEHTDYPWRVQSLSAVYIVPNLGRYSTNINWSGNSTPVNIQAFNPMFAKNRSLYPNWRNDPEFLANIPARYRHLKKFFTSPYMQIEMTCWTATPIVLKPESWNHPDAALLERPSLMPPGMRVDFIPRHYNSKDGAISDNYLGMTDEQASSRFGEQAMHIEDDHGEYLDFATRITNFPSIPVVSNAGTAYLAANQSAIQAQYKGAEWSQTRALQSSQVGYDQASMALETLANQQQIGVGLSTELYKIGLSQSIADQMVNTGQSAIGGILSGNPLSMVGTGVGIVADAMRLSNQRGANLDTLNAQLAASGDTLANQTRQGEFNRDTNRNLAQFAAKGDYAQAQLALNAKVQDALSVQPAMNGQYGGDIANIVNGSVNLSIRWKMLDKANMTMVGEFWLQFGYAVMRSVAKLPDDLMVMSKFTYWKLNKVYLRSGPMPEPHRQGIRGIMEKGVTVWKNPNDIGFTDFADNTPLEGISL